MTKRISIILLFLLLIVASVFFLRSRDVQVKDTSSVMAKSAPTVVTTMIVKKTPWPTVVSLTGQLNNSQGHMVRAEVSGRVTQVAVRSGQEVTKGQVLFQINPSVLRAQLQEALAVLTVKQDYFKQISRVYKGNYASKYQYDLARGDFQSAKAAVLKIKQQLNLTKVMASISGKLGIVKTKLGEYVTAGTNLVELQNTTGLRLDIKVPSHLASQVKKSQRVLFSVSAFPKKLYKANVTAVSSYVDPKSNSINVRAVLKGNSKELMSGMKVSAKIIFNSANENISVPQTAVRYSTFGDSVFLVKNGKAEAKVVTLGERRGSNVIVTRGLNSGDQLVVDGAFKLTPGVKVKALNHKK